MNRKQKQLLLAYAIIFVALVVFEFNKLWSAHPDASTGDDFLWDAVYAVLISLFKGASPAGIVVIFLAAVIYTKLGNKKEIT